MDLSKTFDTLDYFLLIANLEAYGFDSLSLEFMKNYQILLVVLCLLRLLFDSMLHYTELIESCRCFLSTH